MKLDHLYEPLVALSGLEHPSPTFRSAIQRVMNLSRASEKGLYAFFVDERDLLFGVLIVAVGVGLTYGRLFAKPRTSRSRRAGVWGSLLVRVVLLLWLLAVVWYFGIFLPDLEEDLFVRDCTFCLP